MLPFFVCPTGEKKMKRLILVLGMVLMLTIPSMLFAAGSVTVTQGKCPIAATIGKEHRTLIFTCTGDASDGSIPDKEISTANFNYIKGWYLYRVEAYPTSGGTAPDAASVLVFDADDMDLLGSEDGSTAYAGLNLIHATLKKACLPNMYLTRAGLHVNYFYEIKSKLTLSVTDQATVSANWTVVLTFVK